MYMNQRTRRYPEIFIISLFKSSSQETDMFGTGVTGLGPQFRSLPSQPRAYFLAHTPMIYCTTEDEMVGWHH